MIAEEVSRPRVLLVDDSKFARKCVARCLRGAGFQHAELIEAEHGEAALAVLAEQDVQLLITDLVMPVMDGAELVRRVRADERFADLPIAVVSSIAAGGTKQQLLDDGANLVVAKPINGPKSLQILRMAMAVK